MGTIVSRWVHCVSVDSSPVLCTICFFPQLLLSQFYMTGMHGVERNLKKALHHLNQAASDGHAGAYASLGKVCVCVLYSHVYSVLCTHHRILHIHMYRIFMYCMYICTYVCTCVHAYNCTVCLSIVCTLYSGGSLANQPEVHTVLVYSEYSLTHHNLFSKNMVD